MYRGQTLFSQVMQFMPWMAFSRIVARYHGNLRVRRLPCSQQFRAMAFGQLTKRKSLRSLTASLGAVPTDLYHAGFTSRVHFSTLARANRSRSWRIYADLAQRLIARARALYADEDLGLDLNETVYGRVGEGVTDPLPPVAVARRLPDGPRPDPDVRANASGSSLRL